MGRLVLIAWLSLGVLLGPNVCCCTFATAFSTTAPADSRSSYSCCCRAKQSPLTPNQCPGPPRHKHDCPCKKAGHKNLILQAGSSCFEVDAQWTAKAGLGLSTGFTHFSALNADSSRTMGVRSASKLRDRRALARGVVLRC